MQKKQISMEEADCLLYSSVLNMHFDLNLTLFHIKKINGRDARIAFLFTRLFAMFMGPFKYLGLYPHFTYLIEFDGLLFHYIRQNFSNVKLKEVLDKCHEQFQGLKIYDPDFNLI